MNFRYKYVSYIRDDDETKILQFEADAKETEAVAQRWKSLSPYLRIGGKGLGTPPRIPQIYRGAPLDAHLNLLGPLGSPTHLNSLPLK